MRCCASSQADRAWLETAASGRIYNWSRLPCQRGPNFWTLLDRLPTARYL